MKIAIFSEYPHFLIGDVETYTNELITLFTSQGNHITEYVLKNNWNKKKVRKPQNIELIKLGTNSVKIKLDFIGVMHELVNDKNVDLIISTLPFSIHKAIKSNKVIQIQSTDTSKFKYNFNFKWYFNKLFNKTKATSNNNNILFKSSNTVYTTEMSIKADSNNNQITIIPPYLHSYHETLSSEDNFKDRKKIMWTGLFDNKYHNISALNKIKNFIDIKNLFIYGEGQDINIFDSELRRRIFQPREGQHHIKLYDKAKVFILTSKNANLPFGVIDALSNGVPVVTFNSFDSSKWLELSGAVFSFDLEDIEGYTNKINQITNMEFSEWKKISDKGLSFAKKYFNHDKFLESWNDYVFSMGKEIKVKHRDLSLIHKEFDMTKTINNFAFWSDDIFNIIVKHNATKIGFNVKEADIKKLFNATFYSRYEMLWTIDNETIPKLVETLMEAKQIRVISIDSVIKHDKLLEYKILDFNIIEEWALNPTWSISSMYGTIWLKSTKKLSKLIKVDTF